MTLLDKLGVAVGSVPEWYDFAIYAYFSIALSNAFFPNSLNADTRLIFTFGIFAITYLARPIGAIWLGRIADKYGRVRLLKLTPVIITLSSVLIAILPGYAQIGFVASIILLLLRFIQGLCLGGDFCGSIVYLVESARKWKFLHGSFGSCIGSVGILISSLIATLIFKHFDQSSSSAYSWRIAFALSLPFGLITLYSRRHLQETTDFKTQAFDNVPIHFRKIMLSAVIIAIHAATFYYFFIFLPSFIVSASGATEKAALINNSAFLLCHIAFVPLFGFLADRVDAKKLLMVNYSILLLVIYPLVTSINLANKQFSLLLWAASILTAVNAGVIPALITSFFPTRTRCLSFGLSFNLSFSVFGGLTPVICLWLFQKTSSHGNIALYLICIVLLSLIALAKMKIRNER